MNTNKNWMRLGVLTLTVCTLAGATRLNAASSDEPRQTAAIMGFAYQAEAASDTNEFTAQACREAAASMNEKDKLEIDPKTLDALSDALESKLSKKLNVISYPAPASIPTDAVVISGCIYRADSGNTAGKLVGMNMGASKLAVHILFQIKTSSGYTLLDSFDDQVKGGSLLPPIGPVGLVVHAIKMPKETLSADAKKMAGRIAKKLAQDLKQNESMNKAD
jgi:hypothetical protein